jgi:myo-inositol 2-dehydrogenase/D-chiro-inositol 1-dehydrogenase
MRLKSGPTASRRQFMVGGAAAATALVAAPFVRTGAAKEAPLRVGVVGTGGRGTGACANALVADPAVELVAMADIGSDRIALSLENLRQHRDLQDESFQKRIKVTEDATFVGFDGYRRLLELDLSYVILTAPPGFRPLHYAEAVRRGLHVFAEKPVATDPVGCRAIRATAEESRRKGLSSVVGLNYRHDLGVMETVKRVHDGAIGRITSGTILRMGGGLWHRGSDGSWSPLEFQCRNWYYFCWLGGDQIVEQVIHQIDLMNWVMGATPVSALAQGGRLKRTGPLYGNIFDHMSVEFEYPGGVPVHLMCRQWTGCDGRNVNRVIGTLGETDNRRKILGNAPFEHHPPEDPRKTAVVHEHVELIDSIRKGAARNDLLDFAIDSTLTAIMGRESAYTGRALTWEEISASGLDLFPRTYPTGPPPDRPVALPGTPRPA